MAFSRQHDPLLSLAAHKLSGLNYSCIAQISHHTTQLLYIGIMEVRDFLPPQNQLNITLQHLGSIG